MTAIQRSNQFYKFKCHLTFFHIWEVISLRYTSQYRRKNDHNLCLMPSLLCSISSIGAAWSLPVLWGSKGKDYRWFHPSTEHCCSILPPFSFNPPAAAALPLSHQLPSALRPLQRPRLTGCLYPASHRASERACGREEREMGGRGVFSTGLSTMGTREVKCFARDPVEGLVVG